jgi:radical SAM protein with 4Fe4S-binding SPASM domain
MSLRKINAIKDKAKLLRTGLLALLKPTVVNSLPRQINIEVSTSCNLKCKSCFRNYLEGKNTFMPFDRFKHIIDTVSPDMICLVGFGEPMLHPQFFGLLAYAADRNIQVSVTTNGTCLSQNIEDLFSSSLYTLTVSLDAPDRETYAAVRDINAYDRLIEGLEGFKKRNAQMESHLPKLVFHYVVSQHNYRKITDFVNFSSRYKPSLVFFQPLETFSDESRALLAAEISKTELHSIIKDAIAMATDKKLHTNLDFWISNYADIWKKYETSQVKPISRRPCVRPWISSYIDIDGNIYPCCGLSTNTHNIIGNVFRQSFTEIWNSLKYRKFRENICKGNKFYSGCDVCIPLTIWDKYRYFSAREMI